MHERCLRIIYNNKTSSFVNLLAKDGSDTIHTRNLQVLATEIFKIHKNMSTELMQGPFCVRQTHYTLKNHHHFAIYLKYKFCLPWFWKNIKSRIWYKAWNMNLVSDRLKERNSIGALKSGSLKSVRVGYVRPIYLKWDFCNPLQVAWPDFQCLLLKKSRVLHSHFISHR